MMKKVFIVLVVFLLGIPYACEKECIDPEKVTIYDTILVYDTIPVIDTITVFDTIIVEPPEDLKVGDRYQGGIVVFLEEGGQHGLIAAENDLYDAGYTFVWGSELEFLGATSEDDGRGNTELMKESATSNSAAYLFIDLNLNGYDDWFIPAKNQLQIIKENAHLIGNFPGDSDDAKYWSSTELSTDRAYGLNMIALMGTNIPKNYGYRIRPMREF